MRSIVPLAAALALAFNSIAALAQSTPPRVIRGEIVSVEGANIDVRSRSGEAIKLHLKDGQEFAAIIPAQLSDIKPGVFVGAAAMPGNDGTLKAMEVHIFPEALRGSGEGFRAFDLAPGSTMTNANISAVVDTVSGPKLTLTYKGGEQTVMVDKSTPIVTFAPGAASDLTPGASIKLYGVSAAADGAVEAIRIQVGRSGTKVPM